MIIHNFKSLKYKVATCYEARLAICKGHKENMEKWRVILSQKSWTQGFNNFGSLPFSILSILDFPYFFGIL